MEQMTLDEFIPMDRDPLLKEVARYIVTTGKVSISSVQIRFRIGFRRADKIMFQLAEYGVIPKDYLGSDHPKPLMKEEEFKEWMRTL